MFKDDIYELMLTNDETWIVYDSGAALMIGVVNRAIAIDC